LCKRRLRSCAAAWGFVSRLWEISPVKHIVALLVAVLAATTSGDAAAQDVLSAPMTEGVDLPSNLDLTDDLPTGELVDESGEAIELMPESAEDGSFGNYYGDPMHLDAGCAPLFESSGTWLRRGFWYAEGDYMLMNRSWDRKGLLFAFEGGQSSAPGINLAGQPAFGPVLTLNPLIIEGSKPGADGMARVTLGRFLFRDERNRDHNLQATYFGGGSWKSNSAIQASSAEGLNVNDFIDRINPSFDGAESMAFDYETGLDSFETNYIVKSRLGRDQMVLQPDGQWVRSANTSQTYSFLVGLRYLNLVDVLNISAERDEDDATSQGGTYFVDSDNNLFGGQLGVSVAHETARWSMGMNAKVGSYFNRMNMYSEFLAGPELIPSRGTTDVAENNLSFVADAEVLLKWHLRPNLSLRAGFELLYVDSVGLAPHQVNFIPGGYPPIADDGDVVLLGTGLGIEAYR
jgi:hypothetical protein